jgi:hypothetical protein
MLKRNNLWLLAIPLGFIVLRKLMSSNTTNKKLSKNFDWKEFESKDGAVMPEDIKKNINTTTNDISATNNTESLSEFELLQARLAALNKFD